jgi:alpha-methylacyl-CoA racemase
MALPLEDLRVLDLSRLLPGPFCSLLLADCGADVIKVEDTGMGDYARWSPPFHEGVEKSASGALFLALNRNKRSIRVNLKSDEGRELLLKLAEEADIVLESFRPGVLDRLGVGYEALKAVNPGVVYCAISGYGQDGPYAQRAGHDMNYLANAGLLGLTGDVGGPPVQSAAQIADIGAGSLMAAFAILAAIRERDRSGEGQSIDISMTDGALAWMVMPSAVTLAGGKPPRRGEGELAGGLVCYRPYECKDGWVSMGALEPKFWKLWCEGVFMERTRAEWADFAAKYDCCVEPLLEVEEALESELFKARGMVTGLTQPGATNPVRVVASPLAFSRTPVDNDRLPAPSLGEHTHEVLAAAGYDAEQVAALEASGAIGGLSDASGSFLS